jgi:outer membrane receptor protein involved in Fe transport
MVSMILWRRCFVSESGTYRLTTPLSGTPATFRADAAASYTLTERLRLQVNVENLSGKKYYLNADNTPIPRQAHRVRCGLG